MRARQQQAPVTDLPKSQYRLQSPCNVFHTRMPQRSLRGHPAARYAQPHSWIGSPSPFICCRNSGVDRFVACSGIVQVISGTLHQSRRLLIASQILFRAIVYDRFYKDKLLDFVDVLSLANLSVMAFDELCHGYYLHGRSVHPCADTNIGELNACLRREQVRPFMQAWYTMIHHSVIS